jgi:hypothetical protein
MHYERHFSKKRNGIREGKNREEMKISQKEDLWLVTGRVRVQILVLVCGVVPALAQQPEEQPKEIRCAGGGTTCQTGFIPAFSSNGGSAKVKDSVRTITHYDGKNPSCTPHVYGGDDVRGSRWYPRPHRANRRRQSSTVVGFRLIRAGRPGRINTPDPGNCRF